MPMMSHFDLNNTVHGQKDAAFSSPLDFPVIVVLQKAAGDRLTLALLGQPTSSQHSSTKGEDWVQWRKGSKLSHTCWWGGTFAEESNRQQRSVVHQTQSPLSYCVGHSFFPSPLSSFVSSLLAEDLSPSAGLFSPSWSGGPNSWALNSSRACLFDSISSCSFPLSESFRSSRSSR